MPIKKADEPIPPPKEQEQQLKNVVEENINPMKDAFLEAAAKTQDDITQKEMQEAITAGNYAAAEAIINWELFNTLFFTPYLKLMKKTLEESGKLGITFVPGDMENAKKLGITEEGMELVSISFNLQNPNVVEWLEKHSSKQITAITEETRKAIQGVLAKAERDGIGIDETARRIKPLIGLNNRQAIAVENYRKRLDDEVLKGKMTRKQADKLAKQYIADSLDYRASNIAQYELFSAMNAAQQLAYEQQIENGLINENEMVKTWNARADARTCQYCRAADQTWVEARDNFSTGLGTIYGPPLHNLCRCWITFEPRKI